MAIDIKKALKKWLPHLLKAKDDNLNEADTRQRISKVLEEVLGYDLMANISREAQIKEKYVDFAIKLDGATKILVEAKPAGMKLRDRHIEQAQRYASEGNIRWVLLTNGVAWNLYHLTFEEGIDYERAFALDLSEDSIDKCCDLLALLHKTSVQRDKHEEFWEKRAALSAQSIAKSIFTEDILRSIRREIRRREGISIDEEDLALAIQEMFTPEARQAIGPIKIRRKPKKVPTKKESPESQPSQDSEQTTANN